MHPALQVILAQAEILAKNGPDAAAGGYLNLETLLAEREKPRHCIWLHLQAECGGGAGGNLGHASFPFFQDIQPMMIKNLAALATNERGKAGNRPHLGKYQLFPLLGKYFFHEHGIQILV
ncbi:MAG: hypothetical protein P8168_11410 [Deltaproteobacteria bacterium]